MSGGTRFPFTIIATDEPGQPSGPARVKSLLKVLARRYRLRVEWQAGNAARSGDEPDIASAEIPTPQIERKRRKDQINEGTKA